MTELVWNDRRVQRLVTGLAGVRCLPDDPCVGRLRDGYPIGGFVFTTYLGASIQVHMGGVDGRWCSRDLLLLVFRYAFDQLKVKKLIAPVPSTAPRALEQDLRAGFHAECKVTDAVPGGDLILLTMTREQCRWLDYRHQIVVTPTSKENSYGR